ncbi:helix-turn-helix transcriptional regulator [Ottowia sp. VDI28]|uniref:helix-turn-helix transcriptional regulator n=1 Tax=Ottowia sp. VDI28 TaxID=3133968 RepID=UPI003C2E4D3D
MTATSSPTEATQVREKLLRINPVLSRVPVSRSAWYQGIKDGKFPAPIKLGPRTAAWRESDINKLIQDLAAK